MLLVEDDSSTATALSVLLRRYGWTVDVVSTVGEANQYLDQFLPAVVILDLMLPDGEGTDVLDRIRREGSKIRVAVTTASSDPDRLKKVRSLTPEALLLKPIDLAELLKVM